MNKAAIEKSAVWARTKLISEITYKMGLIGITDKGIAEPLPQSSNDLQLFDIGTKNYAEVTGVAIKQRSALVNEIKHRERTSNYNTALTSVIEEVAYTWFNRLVAVRFMEVNDYLPSHIRVLSSENPAKSEPDLVTNPFDADLTFTPFEQDRIMQLKDENRLDELFRMLFIKQCNKLHDILPDLFEKTDDYSELLLTISFTDKDGVVYHLIHDISEDDFNVEKEGQVEIIGWLYQYYISERHDQVVNVFGKTAVKKDDIPAATQLFTTDWVVRYMVDNSLGRYWIERNPQSKLADKLQFFVTPKDGNINYVNEKVSPEDLTFFDPCMGSGHILVYAFDVLMEIYRECGYSDRDAAVSIIENNLFGLDIDKRAYQLAYFAVMMKARSYNRRIFTNVSTCSLASIDESDGINRFAYETLTYDKEQNKIGEYLIEAFRHAKEIGSLQTIEKHDYKAFAEYLDSIGNQCEQIDIFSSGWLQSIKPLMEKLCKQAEILSRKFAVVCTNPPYLNKYDVALKDFVTINYKPYSGDLFSVFMFRNFGFCKEDGYSAFMTPNVWMFIKTYEALRNYVIEKKGISTLVQMAKGAFFKEATVDICAFVLSNKKRNINGTFIRLEDFKGDMNVQKEKVLEALKTEECEYVYETDLSRCKSISGSPIAYWVSDVLVSTFEKEKPLKEIADAKVGLQTGENDAFLRLWFEVDLKKICFNARDGKDAVASQRKWFPYNKGGAFRKWYGNNDYVVNWENDGFAIKHFYGANGRLKSRPQNTDYYFRDAITWSYNTSGLFNARYKDSGFIFDVNGVSLFIDDDDLKYYVLGLLCSNVASHITSMLNPTINMQVGDIQKVPVLMSAEHKDEIIALVKDCIALTRDDWNSNELSWEYNPYFLTKKEETLKKSYENWEILCRERHKHLKENEERLNKLFSSIYGLDTLTCEVKDRDVSIALADNQTYVKSIISYAVGCMFGRFSVVNNHLVCAGKGFDFSKYESYLPDEDNCIPITDEEYFKDDIVGRFCSFIKVVFGEKNYDENILYIANSLQTKGDTPLSVIRNYFVQEFFTDHCEQYSIQGSGKRPIYWMFDSGKQNGFKALVYMHRWNADTIGNMRVEYLHRMQRVYESEIARMQETIDNSTNSREVSAAEKRKDKLTKQLKETKDYDTKIARLALSRIDIDLDDGVKVNYEKVQTPPDGKNMGILTKIK